MAKGKFLDLVGLSSFKAKIIELIVRHTSNNNIHTSSEEKENLSKAYSHSTSSHAPTDAEKNIIVGVQVNNENLTVDSNRKVNVAVPTKLSELENDKGFITSGNGISETISTTEPEINDSDVRWIEPLE